MCFFDPPEPEPIQIKEPEVLVNPFDNLDEDERVARASRIGTSSLRIPLATGLGIGFSGRGGAAAPSRAGSPLGNAGPRSTGLGIGGAPVRTTGPTAAERRRAEQQRQVQEAALRHPARFII